MARSNRWSGRQNGAAVICVAAIVAASLLAGSGSRLCADELGHSQLIIKAPGLTPLSSPIRQASPTPAQPTPPLPSKPILAHEAQPAPPLETNVRSGPVVRMAQPVAAETKGHRVAWQANQEPVPPGGSEYTRGTGVPPIGSLTINTLPATGRLPEMVDRIESMEAQLGSHEYHREWLNYSYFWEAPAFYNRPLYFQEVNLERYGYNWGIFQPVVSGAWFYVKIPLLPYMMTVHPPCECTYSLGYYRPGSCVPYQINWPEVRLDAALVEAGFITGLCFLIP